MKDLEIERKFLVRLPSSWVDLAELFDDLVDVKRIKQMYLKPNDKGISPRIRKTEQGLLGSTETVFHFNQKKFLEPGIHEETEHEISEDEYQKSLKDQHPDKSMLEKTRFVFKFRDQCFELDVFKGALSGLAILELELEDKAQEVELPPFLRVMNEITSDRRFTNFSLANKKLHQSG
jgi:CYTH domain-containing protein